MPSLYIDSKVKNCKDWISKGYSGSMIVSNHRTNLQLKIFKMSPISFTVSFKEHLKAQGIVSPKLGHIP